ncbi:MAG TPA: serine--tRNA ligase, partial [Ramlibacter sp.]|nr:serine--tRNA ligase [Ramlibacter sp.]
MLDITLLRKDLPSVIARLEARKKPQAFLDVAAFTALEAERKAIQTRAEELQSQRNQLSRQIGQRKAKGEPVDEEMARVAALKGELDSASARLDQIQPEMQALLMSVPNLPHESVPIGDDEHGNREVRKWGA